MSRLLSLKGRISNAGAHSAGTAVVTGASSGIGREFARQLAADGYKLVVIARRREELSALAADLFGKYHSQVDVVTADLTDPAELERAAVVIETIPDLVLLVNNAGYGAGGRYDKADTWKQMGMIALHVAAPARLSRAALPGMVARGHGGIINVASFVAFAKIPGSIMYCSTKKWLVDFSVMLVHELSGTNVRVQALCPGFTRTEGMAAKRLPDFLWTAPETVVRASLCALPYGRVVYVPGILYKIIVLAMRTPLGPLLVRMRKPTK
jgi:short-subunit dehydrogenase